MSDHLSPTILSALVDGALTGDELVRVNEHLAGCAECTASALAESLLKSATARAGQRYAPSASLRERMELLAAQPAKPAVSAPMPARSFHPSVWIAVAAMLLLFVGLFPFGRSPRTESEGLVTEACDQHIAMLAANAPPEVISSDRHTVKPWFQGKLPFSFNLPQDLPGDVTLDGANLTYLHSQPTAQLLYSIGKHRVSVFVQQRANGSVANGTLGDHAGFHLAGFHTADLDVVGVSDVDAARLSDLMSRIGQAQMGTR